LRFTIGFKEMEMIGRQSQRRRAGGVLACLLLFLPVVAAAQMAGIVRGTVVDANGAPVAGARVTFAFEGGLTRSYETTTDARGTYSQIGLAPGPYTVTAAKQGVGEKAAPITLRPGGRLTVNLELSVVAPPVSPVATALQSAITASREGRHEEAITRFEEAIAADPKCYDCQYNLGLEHTSLKHYEQAERAFKAAQALKPAAPEALEGLAGVYNATRRFDEAAKASEAAISLRAAAGAPTAGDAGTVFDQGLVLWNAGKIDDAVVRFRETLRLDPNHGEAHYWLGMGHLNKGSLPEAAQELELYLSREPKGRFADRAKTLLPQIKKPLA
jgi:Flp pilus assembly protein TadD